MGSPLVSVMVVAHDADQSLGFALASVSSQTVSDWECIVVDDGSQRPAGALVESLRDGRFRYVRLNENRGRGNARQRGLEAASGRWLAILDADDWMYPARLEAELECLRSEPHAKMVGASMMIEDPEHRALGVQDIGKPAIAKLGAIPLSFATILVEMNFARAIGFDARLTRSEDVLFLTRALSEPWARVSSPLYAYRPSSPTRASTLEGYRCTRMAYAECRTDHPILARRLELAYGVRELVQGASPEPVRRQISAWSRRRFMRPPTSMEKHEHERALVAVTRCARSLGIEAD